MYSEMIIWGMSKNSNCLSRVGMSRAYDTDSMYPVGVMKEHSPISVITCRCITIPEKWTLENRGRMFVFITKAEVLIQ